MEFSQLLERIEFGNTILNWLQAAGALFGVVLVLSLARRILIGRVAAIARRTTTEYDDLLVDLLSRTRFIFILAMGVVVAWHALENPPVGEKLKDVLLAAALFVQSVIWGNGIITFWVARVAARQTGEAAGDVAIIRALGATARVVLFVALFLFALNSVWNITPLIAGLGIGGIAVALAVQNILGDLFGAVTILVDKPFAVGDFVVIDDQKGTIEHVGLKSTRVRSLGGEQIVFSNADMLKSRIRNFKRMQERRVVFMTGVAYSTSNELLIRIPQMIREMVESQSPVRFERCHFLKYADSWLEYETVFWVLQPDYMTFADIQQAINIEMHRRFGEEGIEFAFPSRSIYMESVPPQMVPEGVRSHQ